MYFLLMQSSFAKDTELIFNTQEFAPFNYSLDGKTAGPVLEIINRVCSKLKISCKSKVMPWRRAIKEVREGEADGLFVVGKNKTRESWLYFSLPIITTEYGFFVLKSNHKVYKSKTDIQGYKVGVFGPSNTHNSLLKISEQLEDENKVPLDIRTLYDDSLVFKQLNSQTRGLQAVYSNKDVGNGLIKKLNLKNLRYMGKQKELNYYISFSKKTVSKEMVDKFNGILLTMHLNNELKNILEKYSLQKAILK